MSRGSALFEPGMRRMVLTPEGLSIVKRPLGLRQLPCSRSAGAKEEPREGGCCWLSKVLMSGELLPVTLRSQAIVRVSQSNLALPSGGSTRFTATMVPRYSAFTTTPKVPCPRTQTGPSPKFSSLSWMSQTEWELLCKRQANMPSIVTRALTSKMATTHAVLLLPGSVGTSGGLVHDVKPVMLSAAVGQAMQSAGESPYVSLKVLAGHGSHTPSFSRCPGGQSVKMRSARASTFSGMGTMS
mmetsp:Transcript_29282/g.90995  ORF Transcript_29282/g.90995 Transcript_29282/m.90995 type:complete len:241 (+) Transcript_29282:75-797(+)